MSGKHEPSIRSTRATKGKGHTIIEITMVGVVLVVLTALCADVGLVSLASTINDSACRDAARAASQGSTAAISLSLAQAAIRAHKADGYFVSQPTINTGNFVYQDFGGNPPADTSPYVSVTTSSTVRVPAPVIFMGAQFEPGGQLTFTRTYTFPIVKTSLYLP